MNETLYHEFDEIDCDEFFEMIGINVDDEMALPLYHFKSEREALLYKCLSAVEKKYKVTREMLGDSNVIEIVTEHIENYANGEALLNALDNEVGKADEKTLRDRHRENPRAWDLALAWVENTDCGVERTVNISAKFPEHNPNTIQVYVEFFPNGFGCEGIDYKRIF